MDNIFHAPQLAKRNASSKRFKLVSLSALVFAVLFLFWFLGTMIFQGLPAFKQAQVYVDVTVNEETLADPRLAVDKEMRKLVSKAWFRDLPMLVTQNPELNATTTKMWVVTDDQVDQYLKGHTHKLKENQIEAVDALVAGGLCEMHFNTTFFTTGDSKIPEKSGFLSAIIGSLLTIFVTMAFAIPVGVATAVYLEEFAPKNRVTDIIEININNLAAIPSILYGLLGLAVFIGLFGLPRSSPIVGGLTLGLMTLPIIIVSASAALRSVPASIREAGYGLGLTKWQIVRDHVTPLAFPGILTGSIIGMAHGIGETAPLIIVGMIAFIPDASFSFTDAATVMPAQIFTWAGMPEVAYVERTAAAILVLLTILLSLNAVAIYLRKKLEVKW